ncbi:Receptor-type guanylate cyclase gcy-7 [Caenorhabditis elegans]|uniref:Receptor-type guanylate cyclase gcy-7 n=1 Tax=Caenorhabditis elegans TaxID=6239 RepID=GCY7_CAEEL|nr:Receptor-type guanylate cyclase gcy-7 [Caenorhabditis elegans]H2L002.1 RecName: Full=Receptor-type guanylate cyclase gcy-7; Flags: Precursor [Caenorhabditis elegans]CCD70806.1 Receptor-type guanylate cyclase gcy-7 [Caenorhabditis elegans]|eukprot:NP_001023955.1 Receptor-type guanylate cyclase gcy-7 [Caenorhabditis elegans]
MKPFYSMSLVLFLVITLLPKPMFPQVATGTTGNVIRVGFIHCRDFQSAPITVGYRTSAAAASIAVDRLKRENLMSGWEFNFTIEFDDCVESEAAGMTVDLIEKHNVDVIIGPTMNQPTLAAFIVSNYFNRPIIAWGLVNAAQLDDFERFPNAGILSAGQRSLGVAIRAVLKRYEWSQFVYAYFTEEDTEKCVTMRNDLQQVVSYFGDIILAYSIQVADISNDGMIEALKKIQSRGRIIVTCMKDGIGLRRKWLLAAEEAGMIGDEYVYVFSDIKSKGYVVPLLGGGERPSWILSTGSDENDTRALKAFKQSIFICDMMGQGSIATNYTIFGQEIIARMKEAPYFCTKDCEGENFTVAATYAGQLHDAVYAYGVALDKMLKAGQIAQYRNATAFMRYFPQSFIGMSGNVTINEKGTRNPTLFLLALDENNNNTRMATIYVENMSATFNALYSDEGVMWASRKNNARPVDVPLCGFTGNLCPKSFVDEYLIWVIVAIVVLFLAITAAACGIYFSIQARRQEIERLNRLWQIPFIHLHQINSKQKGKGEHSVRSLQSGTSTLSSRTTVSFKTESRNFLFFSLQRESDYEPVVAKKHAYRPRLDDDKCTFMRSLRNLDQDNLNRFIGLCLDGPQMLSVWRFCSRGSIADVILKATIQMDNFFIYSLIKDMVHGLVFLHGSMVGYHGMLTSKCCLIDDRWQVKISNYGLQDLRSPEMYEKKDLLWSAPELLRAEDIKGSKEGDVYSLGIICAELITRKGVFNMEDRKEDPEEIIYLLKKGGLKSPRPDLEYDHTIEINPALLHLVRDCFTERPSERPSIETVRSQLRGMNSSRNDNLMDHVFNMLESYASSLEEEVSERTKELVEEKKKSDVLLYRMLPKTVADKLKLGQTVEPETFEQVTIFFSDVVQFTTLASKCTPLQVVNLLNDLYTIFDGIIEKHDVYKVETIGDGYLCVSGLPHRNGNEHVRQIALMSLAFLSSLQFFRVPHLPSERINLRIGMNCGSVVAGVVGLTMPRFCLFGDAVNTASRMESNGKPGKIHVSAEANRMLHLVGGFDTESRGEVIIKGKGVMETFWLTGQGTGAVSGARHVSAKKVSKKMDEIHRQETLKSDEQLSD